MVKNSPAKQETWVRTLGREDTLEKEITIHFHILAWYNTWTEESGEVQSMKSQKSQT